MNQIAEILQVDRSSISRDYQFIREHASDVMSKYLVETIPMDVTKFLARLNAVLDEALRMVERADIDEDMKSKIRALSLARKDSIGHCRRSHK